MSCQHLNLARRILHCEFTKNSESPFWIFCMLTTHLRYNVLRAKRPALCPANPDRRKKFSMRWSFVMPYFIAKFYFDFFHFSAWLLLAGLFLVAHTISQKGAEVQRESYFRKYDLTTEFHTHFWWFDSRRTSSLLLTKTLFPQSLRWSGKRWCPCRYWSSTQLPVMLSAPA